MSHDDSAAPERRDAGLARTLAAIDLRAAEAALLARDPEAYKAAIVRSRAAIATSLDPDAQPVKETLAELDRLAAAPLAPSTPELVRALRELRNLRATRALSQPRAVPSRVRRSRHVELWFGVLVLLAIAAAAAFWLLFARERSGLRDGARARYGAG